MDPYSILGIQRDATQEEIKRAYRRLAMKWHPDRNQDSSDAKDRFHQAAEAYRQLLGKVSNGNQAEDAGRWSAGVNDYGPPHSQRHGPRGDSTGDNQRGDDNRSENRNEDEFADTVFWDVMLDYAIKLAQAGNSENDIMVDIRRNGCSDRLARVMAEKAFNIHAHYASGPGSDSESKAGKQHKSRPEDANFRQERLDRDLFRAFLGQRSFIWSPRDATDYYQVIFQAFDQLPKLNPIHWISPNKRLMRILNFSMVLFAVILLAVYLYPGPSEYKLLSDKQMLQLPFLILPLMFVWTMYRKLWGSTVVLLLSYAATIDYYMNAMPARLPSDPSTLVPIFAICFAPFIFTALFANFIYYLKGQRTIQRAKNLLKDDLDQMTWIKNRSGTSAVAAFLFTLVFAAVIIHLFPRNWDYSGPISYSEAGVKHELNTEKIEQARARTSEALQFFEIAESHFNATPPDYMKAEMAYSTAAANGSLLAAYRLGYMHYTGEGVEQNDRLAFDYFMQASRAPLAFQPHNLELTTSFLAATYFNLGIMYQDGLGTRKNLANAAEMYRRASEFGSANAKRNLAQVYKGSKSTNRRRLAVPGAIQ